MATCCAGQHSDTAGLPSKGPLPRDSRGWGTYPPRGPSLGTLGTYPLRAPPCTALTSHSALGTLATTLPWTPVLSPNSDAPSGSAWVPCPMSEPHSKLARLYFVLFLPLGEYCFSLLMSSSILISLLVFLCEKVNSLPVTASCIRAETFLNVI